MMSADITTPGILLTMKSTFRIKNKREVEQSKFYTLMLTHLKKKARTSPSLRGLQIYDERLLKVSKAKIGNPIDDPLDRYDVWIYTAKTQRVNYRIKL